MSNSKKELIPVFYGDFPVKLLPNTTFKVEETGFPLHWHERIELHRIKKGSLELFCDDKQFVAKKDDVIIISPTLLHSGKAGKDGVVYDVIMFDLTELIGNNKAVVDFLKPLCEGKIFFDIITNNSLILEQIDKIIEISNNRKNYHYMEVIGNLTNLIGLLYKFCKPQKNPKSQTEDSFESIFNYIDNHFSEDISTATLSRIFGYEESYFCRKFKQRTSVSVMKYVQIIRLENAKKLITKTTRSIKQIASDCGYTSNAYFSSRFKETYGITPMNMRKKVHSD